MFAKTIVLSDAFLDMPLSARCLYFSLGMFADDDGFVNNPKSIMRQIGASIDDLNLLVAKKFILIFENGVIVIKHWRINNYLRSDRYKETQYHEEKSNLFIESNGAYTFNSSSGIPMVDQRYTQDRLGKDSIGNIKEEINKEESDEQVITTLSDKKRFKKPSLEEVKAYCEERHNNINPQVFLDFYESKGWKVGNQPMKDWKACVRTWENKNKNTNKKFQEREYDTGELNKLFVDLKDVEI